MNDILQLHIAIKTSIQKSGHGLDYTASILQSRMDFSFLESNTTLQTAFIWYSQWPYSDRDGCSWLDTAEEQYQSTWVRLGWGQEGCLRVCMNQKALWGFLKETCLIYFQHFFFDNPEKQWTLLKLSKGEELIGNKSMCMLLMMQHWQIIEI